MNTTEVFLIAMLIIFSIPWLVWRVFKTDYFAPLVVVQIVMGIVLGPGVLGHWFPAYYEFVFTPTVVHSLNGIAWWAVMLFVMIAGVELDLGKAWQHRRESGITAGLALGAPLLLGCGAAAVLLGFDGWMGPKAQTWQFVVGIGMACAVTALPILILLMEKLDILRQPLGQRILRYASLDDIAIWGVLALILMDWQRVGKQVTFIAAFVVLSWAFRHLMRRLAERDVRFIQLYMRGWDQHGNLHSHLAVQCRDTDQASAALITDLKQRGLLDETLVIWGGEFGRTNYCQGKIAPENYGRDHHPRAFSIFMAGGGVKSGMVYGETDDFGYNITENPVHVHDFQATVMHLMGIDHEKLTYKHLGRRYRLTDVHGKVVKDILA